jgi:hypothetical protein
MAFGVGFTGYIMHLAVFTFLASQRVGAIWGFLFEGAQEAYRRGIEISLILIMQCNICI